VRAQYPGLAPALRLAASQDGALTRTQALAAGLTPRQLRELVEHHGWQRPFHGALLIPGVHPEHGRVRAALLLRPGAVACGITAARLHRLDAVAPPIPDEPVHLLVPSGTSRLRPRSTLVVHRGTLPPDEITVVARMRVTSVGRTLADLLLAAGSGRDNAVSMLDAAIRDGSIIDLAGVSHALGSRPGSVRTLPWLRLVDGRSESPLETRLRLLLNDAGLPPEELQWPVVVGGRRVARLDLAWPSRMVCAEADGAAFHGDPHALYQDRHRQNLLVAAGWTVLRFTWADVVHNPAEVVRAVAYALGRQSAA
jgi:very-short-patch-repair endonuclease